MANDRARPADATPQPARLMLYSQEHYDLMSQFEREHTGHRLTREPKALWALGIVYQDGEVNGLFLSYRRGYAFGKAVWQPAAAPLASSPRAETGSEQEHSGSTEKALPAVANQQQEPEPDGESPRRGFQWMRENDGTPLCVCGHAKSDHTPRYRGACAVCHTCMMPNGCREYDGTLVIVSRDDFEAQVASRRASVLAVDKASEREPPSRSSPNEVAPAAALTTQTVLGEAPLASAPSDAAFTDAHRDAIGRACEKLWNGQPPRDPIYGPRPPDHPLHVVGTAALDALNAAVALRDQYEEAQSRIAELASSLQSERLARETAEQRLAVITQSDLERLDRVVSDCDMLGLVQSARIVRDVRDKLSIALAPHPETRP